MNAETTACRVLEWAASDSLSSGSSSSGALPTGPLREAGALSRPGQAAVAALAELTRRTAARLGAGAPPFGDAGPVSLGALVLAAAVGGRAQAEPAHALVAAVPRLRPTAEVGGPVGPGAAVGGWADAVARHGVVAPAHKLVAQAHGAVVPALAVELREALLAASPLTAVLYRPAADRLAAGATAAEVETAVGLLARPRGASVLQAALAGWSPDPAVLAWRADLLSRLRLSRPDVVIDVYQTARLRHGAEWDARLRWAARELVGFGLPDELAVATVRFWVPLAVLDGRDPGQLRARVLLDGHRDALRLVRRYRLAESVAA